MGIWGQEQGNEDGLAHLSYKDFISCLSKGAQATAYERKRFSVGEGSRKPTSRHYLP